MTVEGQRAAAAWKDPEFARAWAARDDQGDLLSLPRKLAAALVANDVPQVRLIVDVASGPGAFLETFLDEFPEARGVCTDASPAMLEEARHRLARFGDRVDYLLADMTDLAGGGVPSGADVICTSRASHHLDRASLIEFYRDAVKHLGATGWLFNLDHFGPEETWNQRLRSVKKRFGSRDRSGDDRPKHHHNYPLCSLDDHLAGYRDAGLSDVETPWRAFYTVLLAARKG
jgi:SAM-dependent methyltransferase